MIFFGLIRTEKCCGPLNIEMSLISHCPCFIKREKRLLKRRTEGKDYGNVIHPPMMSGVSILLDCENRFSQHWFVEELKFDEQGPFCCAFFLKISLKTLPKVILKNDFMLFSLLVLYKLVRIQFMIPLFWEENIHLWTIGVKCINGTSSFIETRKLSDVSVLQKIM